MNRQEILNMVADADLNATICEKIFNWKWIDYKWYDGSIKKILVGNNMNVNGDDFNRFKGDKNKLILWGMVEYSTNLKFSWILVELLRKNGIYLRIEMDKVVYKVTAYSPDSDEYLEVKTGKSLPELICKVALLCTTYDFIDLVVES